MIAITGATGNIGSKIALDLLSRGERSDALPGGADKLKMLAGKGADTTVVDLSDPGATTKAFSGAEAVFVMIPPNYGASFMENLPTEAHPNVNRQLTANGASC
jgi:NAD(P)H dehydrogenase (quinone)